MSSTYTCPLPPIAPAWMTSEAASGIVMKKRVISGCVTVKGPPRSIWRRKIGITEPDEPSTFPNRTATKRVATSSRRANDSTIHSPTAFDCPSTFFGFAALSVEMKTNRSTPYSTETSTILRVARTLLTTAWIGLLSSIGTCL